MKGNPDTNNSNLIKQTSLMTEVDFELYPHHHPVDKLFTKTLKKPVV